MTESQIFLSDVVVLKNNWNTRYVVLKIENGFATCLHPDGITQIEFTIEVLEKYDVVRTFNL